MPEMLKKDDVDKHALKQNSEEVFAMAYANAYSKHKNLTFSNDSWEKFIKQIPK